MKLTIRCPQCGDLEACVSIDPCVQPQPSDKQIAAFILETHRKAAHPDGKEKPL